MEVQSQNKKFVQVTPPEVIIRFNEKFIREIKGRGGEFVNINVTKVLHMQSGKL